VSTLCKPVRYAATVASCGVVLHVVPVQGVTCIARSGGRLRELSMQELPNMDTSACVAIARGCTSLRSLDMSECQNISELGVRACVHL
jgi:hypothetical protein